MEKTVTTLNNLRACLNTLDPLIDQCNFKVYYDDLIGSLGTVEKLSLADLLQEMIVLIDNRISQVQNTK